jgi:hypothetical protein
MWPFMKHVHIFEEEECEKACDGCGQKRKKKKKKKKVVARNSF